MLRDWRAERSGRNGTMIEDDTQPSQEALPEIAGYKPLRVIGHGGMSIVYLARQLSLGREVALKVMLPQALTDETSRRRFENEARTIARLDHPNIVGIFEVGRSGGGLPYYAMPYLPRGHLAQRDVRRDPARVREIMRALLSALEYAHSRGVVHRDVKAENVLFDDADRPLLADFGIALRRGYGTRVTSAGLAVGSTAYMPPEQARGQSVDGRADLYSVGVLGWEMLTGRLPYNAGDALSMALQHAQEPVPRLPPELRHWQRFFDKALAKSPKARYASAKDMREAMDGVPDRGRAPMPGSASLRRFAAPFARRPRTAAFAALLLAALGFGYAMHLRAPPQPVESATAVARDAPMPEPGAPDPNRGVLDSATDAVDSFLRPLPVSAAERWVSAAEQQLSRKRYTAPQGDNAYESLLAAASADAAHPRLAAAASGLIDALSAEAQRTLAAGDLAATRTSLERAARVAERVPWPTGAQPVPLERMRQALGKRLRTEADAAARRYDRERALTLAGWARTLRLDKPVAAALAARAARIPQPGEAAPDDPDALLVRNGDGLLAIARRPVSRADYGAFAKASGRPFALCRERGSLLRVLAPRTWQSPGYAQSPQAPVVCVSWDDAAAYAQWMSARSGRRYRLPQAGEVAGGAGATGGKAVAEWVDACGSDCKRRIATGRSWRGVSGQRPLEAGRGYDDVAFRLVREL